MSLIEVGSVCGHESYDGERMDGSSVRHGNYRRGGYFLRLLCLPS